jgi:small subunit ribosomal protein S21
MPSVTLKFPHESIDSMLRRFKKAVEKADTLKDYQKHEFYERPTAKRVRLEAAAVKRHQRKLSDEKAELQKIRRQKST